MRKILFRGKSTKTNEWTIGDYYRHFPKHIIVVDRRILGEADRIDHIEVQPETVGQFTGFLAKNRKKNLEPEIYGDDIFRHIKETDNGEDVTAYSVVMWIEQLAAFYLVPIEHYDVIKGNDVSKEKEFSWLFEEAELRDFSIDAGLTKIGNIHDNPELLTNKE